MSYLDEPLGIPLGELSGTFRGSLRDLLRRRGCPEHRLPEATNKAYEFGWRLIDMADAEQLVTRRFYADMVEASVSQIMEEQKLVN